MNLHAIKAIYVFELARTWRTLLQSIASMGPEMERAVREDMFSVENSLKAFTGELGGLQDTTLVATKIVWEREFRQRAGTNAE